MMATDTTTRARRLMVIDDDEISLSLISLLLESEGYKVVQASSGAEALDMLARSDRKSHPSILLADLHMPGLSGAALAAELRRAVPHATLLAMSATPDPAEGYEGFLKKPLDPAAFQALLNGGIAKPDQESNDDRPTLDESVYEKMSRMMPAAALREVYDACLKDTRIRGEEMQAAAASNDLLSLRNLAHAVKGSAGMVGAKKLAAAAAELESGSYNHEQVLPLIRNLLSYCDELHRILLAKLP